MSTDQLIMDPMQLDSGFHELNEFLNQNLLGNIKVVAGCLSEQNGDF